MQKILNYEIGMAIKDRPKIFQVITLVLFAFSLTMILVGSISHFTTSATSRQMVKAKSANHYTGLVSAHPVVNLQK